MGTGLRMERANVRLSSHYGNGTSLRPQHCVMLVKRYTMLRSSRRFAVATARKSHARALHAHTEKLACARKTQTHARTYARSADDAAR
eukprot:11198100-Lingulodinium_polyedra.AAC.1